MGVISSEARRLARLADGVLAAARLKEGAVKPRFSRFSLTELAKRALLTFEKPAEEKKLSVSFKEEGAARVSADADLVERALSNLIENAVKYTKAGGKIQVETGETADGKAVFTVRNEAENPLTDDELSHITERFFRTESAKSGGEAGTGLGLYTVKAALALHGAELKAESAANGVVSFSFALKKA